MSETANILTPRELAQRWKCDVDKVLALIHKGVLPAFSVSPPGTKRPRFRILRETVEAHEAGQVLTVKKPKATGGRPRRTDLKRFFRSSPE